MSRHLQHLLIVLGLSLASAATIAERQSTLVTTTNLPKGWIYQGCYSDATYNRVLSGASYRSSTLMTQESCVNYCAQTNGGYHFAGIEYANECYCGDQLLSTIEPDTDCNMACSGNKTESCGGSNRLNVFSTGSAPTTNPGPGGWVSLGCHTDNVYTRTLRYTEAVPGGASGMTVAQCTATCHQYGFQYAGVEYAKECYCDNAIAKGATSSLGSCSMPCSGNSSEYCGASNAINLYQLPNTTSAITGAIPTGWSSLGCFMDDSYWRILMNSPATPGGSTNMTVENCLNACHSASYTLGGVEYSQECFCGNYLANLAENGGPCASSAAMCNMPCKGNNAETCGGSNRINMYQYGTPTSAVASCQATTTSTATAATPTCFATDTVNSGLVVNGDLEDNTGLSFATYSFNVPSIISAAGIAYTNCHSVYVAPPAQNPPPQYRYFTFSPRDPSTSANKTYTVTFYQGRNSSMATLSNPVITLLAATTGVDTVVTQVPACGGSTNPCPLQGHGGTVWQKITGTVTASPIGYVHLTIEAGWTGAANVVAPEMVLFDDISVFAV